MWASTACSSDSSHRRPPGALYFTTARSFSWPSRKMSAETATRVAYGALDCVPPTIEHGRRFCDPDPARRFAALRCGHLAVEYPTSRSHEPLSYLRGAIAPDLTARPAGSVRTPTRGSIGSPMPARRGGRCCRSGRPTSTIRRTSRRRRSPPRRSCWPSPRAPVTAAERAGLPRAGRRTGSRTGSRSRARTRSTTRSASTANGRALRGYAADARREADRRRPDLRRRRLGRPARAPGALQGRRRRGRAAGRVHRQGPAVGQPAVRLAGAARRRATPGGRARFKRVFELFDLARIDHFRGFTAYWAVPADAEYALEGAWKRGPGARAVRRRPRGAGRAAADRRGPRRDHAAGHAAARVARPARDVGAAVRLHARRGAHRARARPTTRRTRSSTPAPTTATRSAAGTSRSPRCSASSSRRRWSATGSTTPSRTGR